MEKKLINEHVLDVNNDALEAAMDILTKDKNKENMAKFMNIMRNCRFLVPAEFPKNLDKEIAGKLARGENLSRQESPNMRPVVVVDSQGQAFLPAFTSRKHLPEDQNYQAILNVKPEEILRVASDPASKVKGIILNPATDRMILHPQFIDAMKKVIEAAGQTREVTMTREQFLAFARKNVEWGMIPKAVFTEKAAFMNRLDEEREEYIFSFYRQPYGDKIPCPYSAKDFDVMVLNINEETCVASVELPENGAALQSALSLYVIWNPKTDDMHYFTIEKGQQGNVLCSIAPDGKHEELMTAPSSGNELMTILELLQEEE